MSFNQKLDTLLKYPDTSYLIYENDYLVDNRFTVLYFNRLQSNVPIFYALKTELHNCFVIFEVEKENTVH